MDIPSDKLTKFLAIGGLAMAISVGTLAYTTYVKRQEVLLGIYDIKIAYWKSQQSPLIQVQHNVQRCTDEEEEKEPNACFNRMMARHRETERVADDNSHDIMRRVYSEEDDEKSFLVKFDAGAPLYRLQMVLGLTGMVVGTSFSFYGFMGWRLLELSEAKTRGPKSRQA